MKAYRFKLKPAKAIVAKLESTLDICRELYNAGLQERRDAYKRSGISINYHAQALQLPEIKEFRQDVDLIYSQVLQDLLRRLSKAFDNFFRRIRNGEEAGYPRFKGKNRYNSFTYPQSGFKLIGDKLSLSRIGSMRVRLSRKIEGTIKTCSIKREADGWYVIFTVEEDRSPFIPKTKEAVGIDLGIESFATLSNGEKIDNPRHLKIAERRLKTAQRSVSRKKFRSSNRKKAIQLLAKQHLKIKRQRQDFFHKTANRIIKEYDHIAIEDLKIKNLLKNHHLAKAISDVAWNTFNQILLGKAANAGRVVQKVDPRFTSQDCSNCGNRVKKSLGEREHRCIACGFVAHRDHNAAINILSKGRADLLGIEKVTSLNEPSIPRL